MKSKHGFRYVSKIQQESAILLHEALKEECVTKMHKEHDRAKNVSYIAEIGRICTSITSGTIVIYSNKNENSVKKFFKQWVGKSAYNEFQKNLKTIEMGIHFSRFHGTIPFVLAVDKAGEIPITITANGQKRYIDVHLKVPYELASIDTIKRGFQTPTTIPTRKCVSDATIVYTIKKMGSVTPKDAKLVNLSESAFSRRLEKLKRLEILKRVSKYPAIYVLNEVN